MQKLHSYKFILSLVFTFGVLFASAQTKSTVIQTIEGKKYYIHTIEKSQSIYAISKLYGISIDDLYKENPELKLGAKLDQEIKVPLISTTTSAAKSATIAAATATQIDTNLYQTHRVAKGETIYSITHKFNLTEKQLLAYNPELSQGLKVDQLIVIGRKPKQTSSTKNHKVIKAGIPAQVAPVAIAIDSTLIEIVKRPKKLNYNLALILPFRLEQTLLIDNSELIKSTSSFPLVPAVAVDFYLGFNSALDSLQSKEFKVKVDLYDVDDKDTFRLKELMDSEQFKDLDFIFGPFYASGFKEISKKAKEHEVPIVSPITQQNKILFANRYVSKTNPSHFTLTESLADYLIDSLVQDNANIVLMTLFDKDKRELSFVSAFKKYYNQKQKALGKSEKDTITTATGIAGLKARYKPGVKNIIISLSNNPVYVTDFTTQLALLNNKNDITLCGWQSTTEMDNIDQEYLNSLHYVFPHQYNIINEASYQTLINSYIKKQGTYPSEYFFIGFDIACYYLKHLKDEGPDFIYELDKLPFETNYMRFKYARPDATTGFDNRGVFIFRYKDYHLLKTGWK